MESPQTRLASPAAGEPGRLFMRPKAGGAARRATRTPQLRSGLTASFTHCRSCALQRGADPKVLSVRLDPDACVPSVYRALSGVV